MDNRDMFDWLREEMKELRGDVGSIKTTLVSQAASLDYHIKRTDLAEERLELLAEQVEPIRAHVAKLQGAWWLVGAVGVLAGAAAAIKAWLV